MTSQSAKSPSNPKVSNSRDVIRCYPLIIIIVLCSFALSPAYAAAGQANSQKWKTLETKYATVRYQTDEDLVKLNKKIKYSPDGSSFAGMFGKKNKNPKASLPKTLAALFEKVQRILDMRKAMRKVKIKVFSNEKALKNEYHRIYRKRTNIRAWYIFDYNTIYINAGDINEGMLAHEMAHAIIDNYMSVRPPRASAEILARYVDQHLFDRVKTY